MDTAERPVIYFDGQCGLCNRTVDWILRRDKEHVFVFAPLQGKTAGDQFKGVPEHELYRSFWLKDEAGLHRESTAFFRICRRLPWPARFYSALVVVPRPIRDFFYRLIAKHRYKIWGRSETCRIPSPEERAHFLP